MSNKLKILLLGIYFILIEFLFVSICFKTLNSFSYKMKLIEFICLSGMSVKGVFLLLDYKNLKVKKFGLYLVLRWFDDAVLSSCSLLGSLGILCFSLLIEKTNRIQSIIFLMWNILCYKPTITFIILILFLTILHVIGQFCDKSLNLGDFSKPNLEIDKSKMFGGNQICK